MRMTKKVTSIVLAVLMVVSMITVMGAVSASAYSTIGELDTAIRAGGTVVLDNDFTFNGSLYVPAGVTTNLDLAGHKLQSVNKDVIYNDGTLTITDSVGNGQVTAQEACVVTRYGGTTTINCKSSTVFTSKDNGVFMGNGTSGMGGCTWNIKQGTFNGNIESAGYIACGIYAPNDDTWNISGGTFNITNGAGIVQRAGTVNVADGVVINTTGNVTGRVGDSRVVVPCSAIVFDSAANYPALQSNPDSVMNVTGGTFTSEDDHGAVTTVPLDTDTHVDVYGGSFSSIVPDNCCADGFSPVTTADAQGKYTVEPFSNPLVPDMITAAAAKAQDGNEFGITSKYLKGTLLGVQKKNKISDAERTSESGQENGNDIRFIAVLDTNILKSADDYGFVLAKVTDSDTKTFNTENTLFDNLKKGDDRAKTISAKGTYNNVCGTGDYSAYGDPTADTDYKYITCAVNSLSDTDKVAARFYVTIGGKTYYAQYAGYNYQYTGCTAGISLLG